MTWLRAQLDDDERVVAAMEREAKRVKTAPIFQGHPPNWLAGVDIFVSPARWQAEVDAKRQMLDLHEPEPHRGGWPIADLTRCGYCARLCHSSSGISCDVPTDALYPCDTVRLLALPFADRPGYREEWRPDAA